MPSSLRNKPPTFGDRAGLVADSRVEAKPVIAHVHGFRGFAILSIVAGHALSDQVYFFGGSEPSPSVAALGAVVEAIFHGGTIYFALISGLLFSLVLHTKGWPAFFRSKLTNVLSPYVVMTFFFTWYGHDDQFRLRVFEGSVQDYLATVFTNLWTGGAFYPLWYIPILVILYAATPLIAWLLDRPRARWLVWIVMLAPLAASREWPEFSWTNPVYFLGPYTIGMYVARQYASWLNAFRAWRKPLVIIAVTTTAALVIACLIDFNKVGSVSIRETLFYLQKLAIAAVVLVWLHAREHHLPQWLNTLATLAFPLYFLHALLLLLLKDGQTRLGLVPDTVLGLIVGGLVCLAAAITMGVAISVLARRLLGKRSRMLLGA